MAAPNSATASSAASPTSAPSTAGSSRSLLDRFRRGELAEQAVQAIESAEGLDAVSARLRPAVAPLTEQPALSDALGGRPLGHPAHPVYVAVPLGCWAGAVVLDLVGGRRSARAARRLVGIGVLAALPAAASGAHDWVDTTRAEQRVGVVRAAANTVALALFACSWRQRRHSRVKGALTALAGTAVTSAAGFLGGHLAYRRGVGVTTTAFQSGPETWTPLCSLAEIPPEGTAAAFRLGDVALLVARHGTEIRCVEDRCTHRGGPLHEGSVEDGCVTCPWHGSVFDLADGAVVRGPASAPEPAYETRIAVDVVEVRRVEHGSLRANLPAVERGLALRPLPAG